MNICAFGVVRIRKVGVSDGPCTMPDAVYAQEMSVLPSSPHLPILQDKGKVEEERLSWWFHLQIRNRNKECSGDSKPCSVSGRCPLMI